MLCGEVEGLAGEERYNNDAYSNMSSSGLTVAGCFKGLQSAKS